MGKAKPDFNQTETKVALQKIGGNVASFFLELVQVVERYQPNDFCELLQQTKIKRQFKAKNENQTCSKMNEQIFFFTLDGRCNIFLSLLDRPKKLFSVFASCVGLRQSRAS